MAVAVLKERPFDGRLRRLEVDWNARPSIAQILEAQEDVPDHFRAHCVARIIDEIVPREMWHRVRPKPRCVRDGLEIDVVVTFVLPLGGGGSAGGGGGGGKNPIATVASVAVLLAAAAVTAGAAGLVFPALAGTLGAGTIGASLRGASVGIGCRL